MAAGNSPLPPDYHTHTELCKHADGVPADYAAAAAERGLCEIASTDHGPAPDGYDIEHRMELAQFERYRAWVDESNAATDLSVLLGVEADYYEGCMAFLLTWLPQQPLDIVLGSVHYLDYWAFDNPAQRGIWDSVDVHGAWRAYFGLVAELVRTGLYDVVAHIDLPKKFGHRPTDRQMRELVLPVLDQVAQAGMAIEINTSGLNRPVAECFPSQEILAAACEREIPLTFGSDAHTPTRVAADFDLALELAREAGYQRSARFRRREITPIPLPKRAH